MFNPENAAGTVQSISKLAVQKISGKTMKKNIDGITVQQAKFTKLALDPIKTIVTNVEPSEK